MDWKARRPGPRGAREVCPIVDGKAVTANAATANAVCDLGFSATVPGAPDVTTCARGRLNGAI